MTRPPAKLCLKGMCSNQQQHIHAGKALLLLDGLAYLMP